MLRGTERKITMHYGRLSDKDRRAEQLAQDYLDSHKAVDSGAFWEEVWTVRKALMAIGVDGVDTDYTASGTAWNPHITRRHGREILETGHKSDRQMGYYGLNIFRLGLKHASVLALQDRRYVIPYIHFESPSLLPENFPANARDKGIGSIDVLTFDYRQWEWLKAEVNGLQKF